jgi:hypothetical protein
MLQHAVRTAPGLVSRLVGAMGISQCRCGGKYVGNEEPVAARAGS